MLNVFSIHINTLWFVSTRIKNQITYKPDSASLVYGEKSILKTFSRILIIKLIIRWNDNVLNLRFFVTIQCSLQFYMYLLRQNALSLWKQFNFIFFKKCIINNVKTYKINAHKLDSVEKCYSLKLFSTIIAYKWTMAIIHTCTYN